MAKKQLAFILSFVFYLVIGVAAAAFLFFLGTSRGQEAAYSPSAIETMEKEVIVENVEIPETETAPFAEEARETISYYSFTTTNRLTPLNVRIAPGLESQVIGRLSPSSRGYILEKGDGWSKIKTEELEGYASNDYLKLEEITKEEHPYY